MDFQLLINWEGCVSFLELVDVVVQQLGDQIYVRQDHSAAAVPAQT